MKLKKLITESAKLLGIEDQDSILMRCANLVVSNVACNYEDFIAVQDFEVTDGKIDFKNFKKTFLKIKSVKIGGREVKSDMFVNYLSVPNGRVTVEYCYIPRFTAMGNRVSDIAGKINENTLLYGIMAEYASISGLEREEKDWSDKFENLLFAGKHTGKTRRLP